MRLGAVFPQTEFPSDPIAIRDYAQAIEAMGFSHLVAYDHVLGANPDRPGGWHGPYTYKSSFQEPFTLFSYVAGIAPQLGFLTGILILPQRQTVLVAKQAAQLDIFSQGRFRLGVGLGWNEIEYVGLNENFHNRGRRLVEQVALMRQLWTQPLVTFHGKWHTIEDAGINPLPRQQPIPVWFGGQAEAMLRRTARMADGWLPDFRSFADARPSLDLLNHFLDEAGRERAAFGIEPRLRYGDGNPAVWEQFIHNWQQAGATQFSVNTMGSGFSTPAAHIDALRKFSETVRDLLP